MEGDLGAEDSEKELQLQLIDAGVKLLAPPSSVDDLLAALDKLEDLLSNVRQDPSSLIQDGLLPSMKALISDRLFRHPNMDVKISVMSCISEVLRITAPHQPYEDERMKEVFQLTLAAFEKLSLFSGRCYSKALHILQTVAKVRCCVILLDLGCDALVAEIFELLLSTIKFNHPHDVFSNMEEIMTWIIDESDELSLDLLKPLLASVKKENQITSPLSYWLGEKVLKNCSAKVKTYVMKAVKSMRLYINDYADIVASFCQDMPADENVVMVEAETNASHLVEAEAQVCKSLLDDGTAQERNNDENRSDDRNLSKISQFHEEIEQMKSKTRKLVARETLESGGRLQARAGGGGEPNRRGRKPISPTNTEEGYEHSGINGDQYSLKISSKRKSHGKVGSPEKSPLQSGPRKENKPSSFPLRTSHFDSISPPISLDQGDGGKSLQRKGRPKNKETMGSDGRLRIGSYRTKYAEEKPGRYTRRKISAVKNNSETTSGVKNLVVKQEKDIQSDSEGKPLLLFKMKDGKKGTEDKETERSKVSKKPRIFKEYGEELVGSSIKVWWPMDCEFYEGVIQSFDPSKKKHKVLYVDGDQENLNLKKERWFLLDDATSDQDKSCDLPSVSAAAVKPHRKKENMKKKFKIKECDSVSAERSQRISDFRSQTRGRKSGSKPAERSVVETTTLRIKMEMDVDDEETKDTLGSKTETDAPAKDDEEILQSETLVDASKSSM